MWREWRVWQEGERSWGTIHTVKGERGFADLYSDEVSVPKMTFTTSLGSTFLLVTCNTLNLMLLLYHVFPFSIVLPRKCLHRSFFR